MSMSNAAETALLSLIFNATNWANIADNASSNPATKLTIALHTGDPGEAGDMTTNECTYGSYARVTVDRDSGGWTVSGNSVSPVANIDFPEATSGTETATHFSVGTGVGNNLLISGTISPAIAISTGVTPRLTTSTALTVD